MAVAQSTKVKLDLSQASRWNSLTLPYLFERGGLDFDKPAIVFEGRQRTYGELRDRARRVANGLQGLGIESMERVALLSSNRLEYMEIEVGIAAARAIMVPLNWRLRQAELANLLRRSEARAIFIEERFVSTVAELRRSGETPDLRTIITLGGGPGDLDCEELCRSSAATLPEQQGTLDEPHEIIFTSGTTGQPKGVVWSNGGVIWNSIQQVIDYRLTPESSTYVVIDLYYIGGRHDFTWPILHAGGTVHIKRSSGFEAEEILKYVVENEITHILWVPTMLYDILEVPGVEEMDTSKLQMIMCGGQAVTVATTERAQKAFPETDFIQVYGLTEGGGTVSFIPPQYARSKPGSAGKPAVHVEMKLVDTEGNEVPANTDGEILVKAPSMTAGYWDAPELTEQLLAGGWLHTGDMGRFDDDGFLYISGRKRDMIISGGMNIFPSEIEDVLLRHPAVAGVAVIGIPHDRWGETVCAVLELRPGKSVEQEEIIGYCSEHLASFKKPTSVRIVEEIPRTMSGKAQKFKLVEQFAGG
jgi:acyl-CoA synthetase (AMP-forming)/AMP-acid ligase II